MSEQKREIGFWTATSLVIGSMIGSGVFLLPAALAAYGGISMLAWVITAFGSIMLALVFAQLSRRNPAAGGVYAYTRESFGEFAGFLVAWGYWISMWSANASIATAFVGYGGPLLSGLSPSMPDIANTPLLAGGMAIGTVWLLTLVNMMGIGTAGKVQVVTTALKIAPLVIVGIGGVLSFNSSHFSTPDTSTTPYGALLLAAMTQTLFAFVGLEVATIPASAVEEPERTIPRATVVGTIATALIYIVGTAGVMSLVAPAVLAKSTQPFADAAALLGGGGLAAIIGVGAAISAFGALNGWILVVSQFPLAVSRDGLFPTLFARVNARGLPVTGMIVAGVLTSALIVFSYSQSEGLAKAFAKMLTLSTLATLIPYAFCSLAIFMRGGSRGQMVSAGTTIVAILAFIYSLFAIYGAGQEVVFLGFLLIVVGLPVYVWVARQRAAAARA
jgi:APA family basic amino acid/polyamine antiporter